MKEFLETLVKNLVDNPSEIKISEIDGQHTVVYELKVAKEDMGKIIGKRGKTAQSIRILLNAVARKNDKTAKLEILEEEQKEG